MRLADHLKQWLVLLLLLGSVCPAQALDFNAFWLYRTSGGDNRETQDRFEQRYTLGVGPEATLRPTHAITASAGVGYTRVERDLGGGQGLTSGEVITPSARLTLTNDIFIAGLAATASRFSGNDGQSSTSSSWDATLGSRWDIPLWPTLMFNYGKTRDGVNSTDFFSDSGLEQTYRSVNVDWDLLIARLNYRFTNTISEDRDEDTRSESDSHFVRFETDGRVLNNRISYNLSQQFQQTDSIFSSGEFEFGTGLVKVVPLADIALVENLPTDPDYVDPNLAPTQTINPNDRLHLLFRQDPANPLQRADVVRLRFLNNPQAAAVIEWNLYRPTGSVLDRWELVPGVGPIQGQFVAVDEGYVEIPVAAVANETSFLLVALTGPGIVLDLVSVTSAVLVPEAGESRNRNYLTNAGVRIQLTQTLSASANMTLETSEGGSGENTFENDRRSLSGRLRWAPRPWVVPSIGYSESRENRTGAPEQLSRAYSLTVATIPLPTMNMTFGVTQSERYTGDTLTDETLRYSLTTAAAIYPDLNASLFLTWLDSQRRLPDTGDGVENLDESSTFTSRLNLNARLTRKLTADLIANYRTTDRETAVAETADVNLNLQFRPSALLLMRVFYTAFLLDSALGDVMGAGFNLALLRTYKTRLNLNYSFVRAEETSQNIGVTGSWDISRHLFLNTRANYILAESDFYNLQVSLNLRL